MNILRQKLVSTKVGLSKATIYKMMGEQNFPKPIPLGLKSVGWLESDVEKWIESRIAASK